MANQTELERIAIQKRNELMAGNRYKPTNEYSSVNKDALSDGDDRGKGTGLYLDTKNGGSKTDIYGSGNLLGSGRKGNLSFNKYSESKPYTTPDTSSNTGQIAI